MAFYLADELCDFKIIKSIFHIVGPDESNFMLLNEFEIGDFQDFFIERLKSISDGCRYDFLNESKIEIKLKRILNDLTTFQKESEGLAESFQSNHGGSASLGAFIIFVIEHKNSKSIAMLKFDDETVLSYSYIENPNGRPLPKFGEISKTFVKNKHALQKAILFRVLDGASEIVVKDRQSLKSPARYIGTFLDAKRRNTEEDMTLSLQKALIETFDIHKDSFDKDTKSQIRTKMYQAAENKSTLDGEKPEEWLKSVVGNQKEIDKISKTFKNKLRTYRIDGETFELSNVKLEKPTKRRIETASGIKLLVPKNLNTAIFNADSIKGEIIIKDKFTEVEEQ